MIANFTSMRVQLTALVGFLGLVAPSRALLRSDAVTGVANALVRCTLSLLHRIFSSV